jgi:anti-sigma regulatory factor (Ser/Thr protein kinase)
MACHEHFTVAPQKLAVRDARLRVRAFDDLPDQARADAELVVSELVANSLLHADLGPESPIDVVLRRDRDRLSITVDDHGVFARRPRASGGLGFRVLDAVCEEWHIDCGRVTATIPLKPRPNTGAIERRRFHWQPIRGGAR